jgi:DNA-binding MarR family transcriptional regulator
VVAREPTNQPTPDTAGRPAFELMLAVHRLVRGMRAALPANSLNFTQLLVLSQLIDVEPVRIGELARRVRCSQPTATTVVSGLEEIGLVQRIRDTSDGRAITVSLTEQGRDALQDFGRREAGLLDQLIAELPDADRELILAAIPALGRLAEAGSAGHPRRPIQPPRP